MKNVKLISLVLSMLVCFVVKAQEKTVSKDTIRQTQNNQIVICTPLNKSLMNEPLYIIDGIVSNSKQLSKINPNDIKDMKVLKGVEATSVYGNQAVNGVIVITTKEKD